MEERAAATVIIVIPLEMGTLKGVSDEVKANLNGERVIVTVSLPSNKLPIDGV